MDIVDLLSSRLADPQPFLPVPDQAAVVVPLLVSDEPQIVLELRSQQLRQSSGEVGLPGGKVETGENHYQAALRELEEELGVPSERVHLLGRLPVLQRRRGEFISPFVCTLDEPVAFQLQTTEVAEVFRVPVAYLQKHGFETAEIIEEYHLSSEFPAHMLPEKTWQSGVRRPVYYQIYKKYLIWGLTAEILRQLLSLLI